MKSSIKIQAEHLSIISFEEKHLCEEYVSWLNDDQLMMYSEQRHKKHTMDTCKIYLDSFKDSNNYFLAIEDHKGHMLGTMTIYQDIYNRLADLGILIGAQTARGKGMGSEAWSALIDWITLSLETRKITGGCMSSNTAMINIMKNSGMQSDGVRKKHYQRDQHLEDIIYMAKFI